MVYHLEQYMVYSLGKDCSKFSRQSVVLSYSHSFPSEDKFILLVADCPYAWIHQYLLDKSNKGIWASHFVDLLESQMVYLKHEPDYYYFYYYILLIDYQRKGSTAVSP